MGLADELEKIEKQVRAGHEIQKEISLIKEKLYM